MHGKSPAITLNNGVTMPALGLGTYQSTQDRTAEAVETAIANGYRLIDTASVYGNERQVGEGIARSGIARSGIFVTTKLWISDFGYETALHAFEASLRRLGLDYVDLYLLHWPVPTSFETTITSYKAAEKLLADGRVRAIGVSNFSPEHLKNLIERTRVVPAVNQVELNPFFTQPEVRAADAQHRVVTQSWSPIGGVNRDTDASPEKDPLKHPVIAKLAAKYGKTPAQIIIRWHLDHGLSPIPKSTRPERIVENIGVFDFALAKDEIAAIDGMHTGGRAGPDPESFDTKTVHVKVDNEA
jgi:diketogulonate reductase-like aldo/keto reductase